MESEAYIKLADWRIRLEEEPFKSLAASGDLKQNRSGIYFATEKGAKAIASELERRYGLIELRGEEEEY